MSAEPSKLEERWSIALPFLILGSTCIVAGGVTSAATAYNRSQHASWVVAYLVLVAGVAQVALGLGQAALSIKTPSKVTVTGELIAWNGGNVAVIVGTLLTTSLLTDVGGALLMIALALFVYTARGGHAGWARQMFRITVLIILLSIPVGLVLGHTTGN
ncbi:MAG: hypothetical protein ABIQ39_07755 [Ilumatobacteraceae bacterium]